MRLTERKVAYPSCDKQGNLTKVDYIEIKDKKLAEEKLCKFEDIEEKLGIDLIILFKALKNGIYWKDDNGKFYYFDLKGSVLDFNEKMIVDNPIDDVYGETFLLKEYGKTWALTEDELL